MAKQLHCNNPLTKKEALLGMSVGLVSQYAQLTWLLSYVNVYVIALIYGIVWTYYPTVVHIKSWRSISFSKPW